MKDILYIALILTLLYILMTRDKPKTPEPQVVRRMDTVYMPYKIVVKKTDTIRIDTTIYEQVPYLDSTAIKETLRKYFAKVVHRDTLKMKYGWVAAEDTVSQNRLISRTWTANITVPEITKTVESPKVNQYFVGPRLELSKGFNQFGFGFMMKDKKDRLYGTSVGVDTYKNVNFGIEFYIKL